MRNIFAQQIFTLFSTPSAYLFSFHSVASGMTKMCSNIFLGMLYCEIPRKEMYNVKSLLKCWKIKRSCKDNVLENIAKFTGKKACAGVAFLKTFQAGVLQLYSNETLAQLDSYKFCENSKTSVLQKSSGTLFL